MHRRGIWLMVFVLAVLALLPPVARAEFNLTAGQMKAALRTTTIEENGFIDKVLVLMHRKVLPENLVASTFLWARKKPKHKFQYFKYALKLRAADRGIRIPF